MWNRAIHPDNVLKSEGCWYEATSRVFAVTGPVTYMWNGAIHRYNVLKSEGCRYRAISCVFAGYLTLEDTNIHNDNHRKYVKQYGQCIEVYNKQI